MRRGMIGLLCLLLAMAATDSPASAQAETTDPLAAAIAEAAMAPDAALAKLQSLRALPPPEGQRAAVAALRLLIQLKRLDEALALSDALLGDASLGANQKLDTISARLLLMRISKRWDDQERITALVDESLLAAANADSSACFYQELGGLRTIQMRLPEAETALIAGLAIAGDAPSERQAGLHRRLGVVYAQQGKYPEAIEHMQEVERIRAALGLPEEFSLLRNFGSLHVYLEDWDRAIAYLERAESALKAEKNPDVRTFLSLYSTLAGAQTGAGRHAQAHATFDKAFALAAEHGIEDLALLNNRGFLYQRENRHREALPLFERALALSADNRDPSRAGIFEKNIGESLLALGEKVRALEFLERAERAQRESAPTAKRLELLPRLIDALEQNGRSAQALERMREFKRLNDEVVNAEAKERIARLESVVELERKERQLATSEQQAALQSAENEVLRAERQRQRLLIGGILAALLALAVILALLVRDRRFKAAAQQELEARNARIEAQRRDLESLNEALHRQSREDALTGLNNRYFLTEFMASAQALGAAQQRPV